MATETFYLVGLKGARGEISFALGDPPLSEEQRAFRDTLMDVHLKHTTLTIEQNGVRYSGLFVVEYRFTE